MLELATSSSGIYSGKLTPQGPSSGLDLKAHEYFALLVPEAKGEKSKARQQCDGLDRIEEGICLMTLLEMVIRNAGTQMMNMMKADIARTPLHEGAHPHIAGGFHGSAFIGPAAAVLENHSREIMLGVKEVSADGMCDKKRNKYTKQPSLESEEQPDQD